MPILQLIDRSPKGSETHEVMVANREGARQFLKGDLRATSDRAWGDEILARFDAGDNLITRPNGTDHSFTVNYIPELTIVTFE